MRSTLLLFGAVLVGVCCARQPSGETPRHAATGLTTIRYCADPLRTFEIDGADIRGVALADLPEALRRQQREHPGATYEVYAEVKCVPEESDRIIEAIRRAGVTLEHYWAPVSSRMQDEPAGKYGPGIIDLLDT